jgi:hypothetical protein
MMNKLFSYFAKPKAKKQSVAYRAQEIWWCSFPSHTNAAVERPVLVFRTLGDDAFWALPLTSRASANETPFYFLTSLRGANRKAALAQMRVLKSDQLIRRLGKISSRQFTAVNAAIMEFLAETSPVQPVARLKQTHSTSNRRTPHQAPLVARTARRYSAPASFQSAYALR